MNEKTHYPEIKKRDKSNSFGRVKDFIYGAFALVIFFPAILYSFIWPVPVFPSLLLYVLIGSIIIVFSNRVIQKYSPENTAETDDWERKYYLLAGISAVVCLLAVIISHCVFAHELKMSGVIGITNNGAPLFMFAVYLPTYVLKLNSIIYFLTACRAIARRAVVPISFIHIALLILPCVHWNEISGIDWMQVKSASEIINGASPGMLLVLISGLVCEIVWRIVHAKVLRGR